MEIQSTDAIYPIATSVHLINSIMHSEGAGSASDNIILKNIILPYASIGKVYIQYLTDELLGKHANNALGENVRKSFDNNICCDLSEIITNDDLAARSRSAGHDEEIVSFNTRFNDLTAQYAAAETQFELLYEAKIETPPDDEEFRTKWLRSFDRNLKLWRPRGATFDISNIDPRQLVYYMRLPRLDAFKLWLDFRRDHLSFELESLRLRMGRAGLKGIPIHYTNSVFYEAKDKTKVIEIAFPDISVPHFSNISTTIDFVKEDQFIRPIRNLRAHAATIINGKDNFEVVSDNIKEEMHELNQAISKETKSRQLALLKMVIATPLEMLDEIMSLKFGKATKLAFEVSEKALDMKYSKPKYTSEPMYFAWELNKSLEG